MVGNFFTTIKRLGALWSLHARMDLGWFMRDTKYCLLNILAEVCSNLAAIAGVFMLAERFGGIGGMNRWQVTFMLGYILLIDGVFFIFLGMCNVAFPSRRVGRGQIDHMIIQPLPFWMQLASEGFVPVSGSGTFLCGLGITLYTVRRLNLTVTPGWIMSFGINLAASVAIILAVSYILGSMAFYAPVAAEEASSSAIELMDTIKTYPLGGMPYLIKLLLCTVVPVGLAAWFPTNVLLSQTPVGFPALLTVCAAVILTILAAITFKKGMKHYAKFGSPRYHDRGHRR